MESDSSEVAEDGKRRREGDEEEIRIFAKNKKTARSPSSKVSRDEEKMDRIMNLLQSLATDTREIKNEQKEMRAEHKEYQTELLEVKIALEALKKENEILKTEKEKIINELNEVKDRIEQIEKEKKKNNIVITGMYKNIQGEQDLLKKTKDLFVKKLKIEPQVVRTFKIGPNTCVVQLKSTEEKEIVMKNKHKLRNILGEEAIYINEDLTITERKKQTELRKTAKLMTEEGKKVKIGCNKIIVNGEEWR